MKLIDYLSEEFKLLGVTVYGIVATPCHKRRFPAAVTITTPYYVNETTIDNLLVDCEVDYWKKKQYRCHSMSSYIKLTLEKRFNPIGVAVCDPRDQYDFDRGSLIAQGRLLKSLRCSL